jgi:hypothetical protein
MTYQRFRLAESERMPATVATVATEPLLAGPQSVADVATVAASDDLNAAFEERVLVEHEWIEDRRERPRSIHLPGVGS